MSRAVTNEAVRATVKRPRIAARQVNGPDVTLSAPGKMPSYGWSLPAGKACPASKKTIADHGENAVCGGCYAKTGNYRFPNVAKALDDRMRFVMDSLKADNGATFVTAMVAMVRKAVAVTGPYFRIHDSGDFFHPAYVDAWKRIAEALPDVRFWAPTREYLRPYMMPSLVAFAALPNVTVRPSAAAIDEPAPVIPGLSAGSSVRSSRTLPTLQASGAENVCPATTTGNPSCDAHGCRKCWDDAAPVAYALH
jgi:Gene product 88